MTISDVENKRGFDPVSPEGYAFVLAHKDLQLSNQDRLDSFFGARIVAVRNALLEAGWEEIDPSSPALMRGSVQIQFDSLNVGTGANVVGGDWRLLATNNPKLALNARTIARLPDMLTGTAADLADEIDVMMIRETNRISENRRLSPQELTFKEFSEIAKITKLENHGRQWVVEFGQQNLGFADGRSMEAGLREVHARAVSNAVYAQLPDTQDSIEKPVFPPEKVLAEYPDLRVKFAEVFEARDVQARTQGIIETVRRFVDEHPDWWADQLSSAGSLEVQNQLRSWEFAISSPDDPVNAAKCLSMFVDMVQKGHIDWVNNSLVGCWENKLFAEAKSIVDKTTGKAVNASTVGFGDVVGEGRFSGKVLDSVDGVVTQKINRDGATVRHALSSLSGPVIVGAVVEIKYQGGIGQVSGRALDVGNER